MNKLFNSKFTLLIFGFLSVVFFNASVLAQSKNEVLIIADLKADCTSVAQMKCLQVRKPQDEKWSLFYQTIGNFNYTEGYTYIVRVRIDTVKNPPNGGSNLKYSLIKILYREKTARENSRENTIGDNSDLSANAWKLIKVEGAAVNSPKASIRFNTDKKTVGGNGGCNGFGGDFAKKGNEIKITQIISTKMFCDETSDVENKFLGNLERVTKYQISGGKLLLFAAGTIVLEFAPIS